jgi:hypothetical protein
VLYQRNVMRAYKPNDFVAFDNYNIIREVREFRLRIAASVAQLKEVDKLFSDLNTILIMQDMNNALKLLDRKSNKLRQRLQAAESMFKAINKSGEEMDGNTSQNEEDEFLDALKEEMPDVFNNIKSNFTQLDDFDILVGAIQSSKDAEELLKAKGMIEKLAQSVTDVEDLANKLECEVIDWNLPDKLQRRDQEIETI